MTDLFILKHALDPQTKKVLFWVTTPGGFSRSFASLAEAVGYMKATLDDFVGENLEMNETPQNYERPKG